MGTSPAETAHVADVSRAVPALRRAAPFLLLGLAAFALLFRTEIAAAVAIWDSSTAYGHCWFVLPIALYLAWDRRAAISGTDIVALPAACLLAVPLGLAWLAAERLGLMEGRQLVVIALIQVLFLAVLGWRMWRALAVPLLYLVFLVPFGAFVTPALQVFTARFIIGGLGLLSIPNVSDTYTIEIPEGLFYVAEACAGLRFLIAAIAFGVLYACIIYRSPAKRAAFMLASVVIPIIANGFRGLGIVVLGHIIGSAEAAAADHVIYGWVFFSVVILLLIAAGLPFREDGVAYRPVRGASGGARSRDMTGRMALAAAAVVFIAGAGPAAAMLADRTAQARTPAVDPTFVAAAGCTEMAADAGAPPGSVRVHRFGCAQGVLTVTVATLSPRANPSAALAAMRRMTGELEAEETEYGQLAVPGGDPASWRMTETFTPALITATSLWMDGVPAPGGLAFRLAQAWRSVMGGSHALVVVAASLDPGGTHPAPPQRERGRRLLADFLAAQPILATDIAAASAVPAGR